MVLGTSGGGTLRLGFAAGVPCCGRQKGALRAEPNCCGEPWPKRGVGDELGISDVFSDDFWMFFGLFSGFLGNAAALVCLRMGFTTLIPFGVNLLAYLKTNPFW